MGISAAGSSAAPPTTQHLSDVVHGISIFPFPMGRAIGIDATTGGKPLAIGEKVYKKGIGFDVQSEVLVSLDGRYRLFEAEAGAQTGTNASTAIVISLDGKEVYSTGEMKESDAPKMVSLDLTGAKEMSILVGGATGKAVLADAVLTRSATDRGESVDMARFARVVTFDPARMDGVRVSRLEEFPAGDIAYEQDVAPSRGRYTVPVAKNGEGCIGLQWMEYRRLTDIGIEFADAASMPTIEGAKVEAWVKTAPNAIGECSPWQGKWVPLKNGIVRDGNRWLTGISTSSDPEVALGTYKVRWILPAAKSPVLVKGFTASTTSDWETADITLQAEKPEPGKLAKVEIYNGEIMRNGSPMRLDWDTSAPLRLKVRYSTSKLWGLDRTVVRLKMPKGSFGVAVDDVVANGCVYVKDAGLFACKEPAKMTPAQYKESIKDRKTTLERVRQMPDQSLSRAVEALYKPNQDRSPTLLSLAWDNRKISVDRTGTLHFGAPLLLNHYQFFWRYEIQPQFGSGTNAGFKRDLENGWMPISRIQVADGGLNYGQSAYVAPFGKESSPEEGGPWMNKRPIGVAEYSIENPEDAPGAASLKLSFIENVRLDGAQTMDIGSLHVLAYVDTTPKPLTLETIGDRILVKREGELLAVLDVSGAIGLKSEAKDGVVTLSGTLPAKSKAMCVAYAPVEWEVKPEEQASLTGAADLHRKAVDYWQQAMAPSMQIDIPDTLLTNIIYASQVHCMNASRNDRNEGKVIDPWIAATYYCSLDTESHAIIRGMDMMGQHEYAKRAFDYFIKAENPAGYMSHGYTMMGTGQHLWFLADHYRLTGDTQWWTGVSPKIASICQWIMRQRDKTERRDLQGAKMPEYGLVPPGTVADWQSWGYIFSAEGYYYAGLARAAEALAEIKDPKADLYAKGAADFRKEILRAYQWTQSQMPVVGLQDGTWVPGAPYEISSPGPIQQFYPDYQGAWLYDVELGPHHMVDEGVLDPQSKDVAWMADHLEDVEFMRGGQVAGNLPEDETKKDWFSKGGFPRAQPYYGRYPELCALRDDVKPFIRTYFNQLAPMFNREDLSIYENPWASVWSKTHETGHFLQQTRLMFVMERGKDLWLAPFVTSNWMKDGEAVSIKNASTFFGPTSYRIESHVGQGYIEASIEPPTRSMPKEIVIRLRHPEGKRMREVTVTDGKLVSFDPTREIVRVKGAKGQIVVRAVY